MINTSGELIVKAPLRMSDVKVYKFIREKQNWIETKQQQILLQKQINTGLISYTQISYLGSILTPVIAKEIKQITPEEKFLYIPAKINQDKILTKVQKWLKECATEVLTNRINYFSKILNLAYLTVKPNNNAKTRWGSCDTKRNVTLNWRLIMISPTLIDYVVVHELCHILEPNHTQNFWKIVESILPNWKELRKDLKNKGYMLDLFRS